MMLDTKTTPTWCPGCGNFSILATLKNAVAELKIAPHDVLVVSGVGCHGHAPQWINTYGFQGIHGRPLPVAQAAKIANHKLEVIVLSGDGDCFDEGMNHFVHACQRNLDIALLVHNNGVFGLTTGQTSPTAGKGYVSKSTPFGSPNRPINPLTLALDAGATFVGRGFAGDPSHLTKLMEEAITHKGFAFLDIFQPCVTWNKVDTYEFWRKNTYKLETAGHDSSSMEAAWKKAREESPWPLGVFYQTIAPSFADDLPQISKEPLVRQPIDNIDITPLLKQFE